MIIDAHCHACEQWPYQPAVPDPHGRARAERLLWEMDQAGVDQAVLISAAIGGNDDNAAYTNACAKGSAGRLHAFPDVDCRWHTTHHTPGAADRLRQIVARFNPAGFTHYLHEDHDPAWLLSADGLEFFAAAEHAGLIASLACGPTQMPSICALAKRFPAMPFLIHHLGRVVVDPLDAQARRAVLAASAVPNIHIKLSGFGFAVPAGWDFPQAATHELVRELHQQFGEAQRARALVDDDAHRAFARMGADVNDRAGKALVRHRGHGDQKLAVEIAGGGLAGGTCYSHVNTLAGFWSGCEDAGQ